MLHTNIRCASERPGACESFEPQSLRKIQSSPKGRFATFFREMLAASLLACGASHKRFTKLGAQEVLSASDSAAYNRTSRCVPPPGEVWAIVVSHKTGTVVSREIFHTLMKGHQAEVISCDKHIAGSHVAKGRSEDEYDECLAQGANSSFQGTLAIIHSWQKPLDLLERTFGYGHMRVVQLVRDPRVLRPRLHGLAPHRVEREV